MAEWVYGRPPREGLYETKVDGCGSTIYWSRWKGGVWCHDSEVPAIAKLKTLPSNTQTDRRRYLKQNLNDTRLLLT